MLTLAFFSSCNGQEKPAVINPPALDVNILSSDRQIAEYVRNIYEDKNGHLWFGTNGSGVAHFNGEDVLYFSTTEGFEGYQITGITEDRDHNLWFATDQGVVKCVLSDDPTAQKQFTNYSSRLHFRGEHLWSVFADSKGHIWAGSTNGIFRFNGINWFPFELPYPEDVSGGFISTGTTWSITEDSAGNIWFSTNGFGVYKYDGASFIQYTEEDGLTDNQVDVILEDNKGNIWIGTRFGGISRFDGEQFVNFNQSSGHIGNDEVCALFEDSEGNIWTSSEGFGVYRFDGSSFTNYAQAEGLGVGAVQTIFEDTQGRLWVGGGGGLYQFDGSSFFNVTKDGPWE